MATPGTKFPTHEETLGCLAACFEWADSYDTKDWDRLSRCITPTLNVDYTSFLSADSHWPAMPAADYLAMASSPSVLGNPLLKTQHFVSGATRWEKVSDDEVVGHHQLRVPHQRYADETFSKVEVTGHAHSRNKHWYKRDARDGVWRFAGLAVDIYWTEGEFERVFEEGRKDDGATTKKEVVADGVDGKVKKDAVKEVAGAPASVEQLDGVTAHA